MEADRKMFTEMGKRFTPNECPDLHPEFDREGPTSLDNVDYETTKYAIDKDPKIGQQYQFGTEGYKISEYKSIYD